MAVAVAVVTLAVMDNAQRRDAALVGRVEAATVVRAFHRARHQLERRIPAVAAAGPDGMERRQRKERPAGLVLLFFHSRRRGQSECQNDSI
jgi:predicted metal-dependent phosphoesterase TrpH